MTPKDRSWWLSFDRWALVLFALGTLVVNGKNQLRVLGIGLVLMFGYQYARSRARWKVFDHPPEIFSYTIWGIWAGLSGVFVCVSPEVLWANYRILLQMIVMIWCVYGLLRLQMSARLLYWALVLGCLVQLVALQLGYSFERGLGIVADSEQLGEERVASLTGNPNSLGFVMVTGVYCMMQLWRMKRSAASPMLKALLAVFAIVAVYVTWQTGSRKTSAAVAILILGWLVWLLPQGKGVASLAKRISVTIVLVASWGSLLTFVQDKTVVGRRFDELADRGGGSIVAGVEEDRRADMYRAGLEMFGEHPIAGVGLGHFRVFYWRGAYISHSDYIEPLACTGLVGFLLYQSFYWFLIRRVLRLRSRVPNAEEKYRLDAILLTLFVHMMLGLGAPYWSSQHSYLLLTVFVAYTWVLERKLSEQPARHGQRLGFGPSAHKVRQPSSSYRHDYTRRETLPTLVEPASGRFTRVAVKATR